MDQLTKILEARLKEYKQQSELIDGTPEEQCSPIDGYYNSEEEDSPVSPSHYKAGGIETIDYIEAKLGVDGAYGYCIGNVIKYISRAGKKDIDKELEDLKKARWYLDKAINYC